MRVGSVWVDTVELVVCRFFSFRVYFGVMDC